MLLLAPGQIHAQLSEPEGLVVFHDDFSSGNLEKWQDLRHEPGGWWQVVDGQAEGIVTTGSTLAELVPKDEYWNYDWKNMRYDLDYTPLEGVDFNISWNIYDPWDWYEIHFVGLGWEAAHVLPQAVPWFYSGFDSVQLGQTYHITIETIGARLRIFKDSQLISDIFDPAFSRGGGKIGLKVGAGSIAPTRARYDNVVVTWLPSDVPSSSPSPQPSNAPSPLPTPSPTPSSTPLPSSVLSTSFKQTDPQWAHLTYDHAARWSSPQPPSIERWGCALTSLAMIFHAHGLTHLPSGELLTPATLNAWLITQPDGYLGEGLLNWAAAMRLSRIISDQLYTVKLEYQKIMPKNGETASLAIQLDPARTQLALGRPVILQVLGHFMVADSVLATAQGQRTDDVHIIDPFFDYSTFQQHQKVVLSTRVFTPSHTDLSFLIAATDSDAQLRLRDATGRDITTEYASIESLTEAGDSNTTHEYQVLELPKPTDASYSLEVSAPTLTQHTVQIFAYDMSGSVTDISQSITLGSQPALFTLTLDKNNAAKSSITPQYTLHSLLADLKHPQFGASSKQYALRTLSRVAAAALTAPDAVRAQYRQALSYYLEWYAPQLEPRTYEYLKRHIAIL